METQDCIRTRRSIRKYKDKPVEWDKIVQIVNAANFAPSAGNLQNWKIIVVKNDIGRKKLAAAAFNQEWMEVAPIHMVVIAEPNNGEQFYGARGARLYTIQNCAAVIQNILLTANDCGLGSCWVGAFDEDLVRRALQLQEDVSPQAIITIGYADEHPEMPSRKRLEHQVYIDRWMGRKASPFGAIGYTSVMMKDALENTKKAIHRAGRNLVKER